MQCGMSESLLDDFARGIYASKALASRWRRRWRSPLLNACSLRMFLSSERGYGPSIEEHRLVRGSWRHQTQGIGPTGA